MFNGVVGQMVFEEMSAEQYERQFWAAMGGYDESISAQLETINAIETARLNGHSPQSLARIIQENS